MIFQLNDPFQIIAMQITMDHSILSDVDPLERVLLYNALLKDDVGVDLRLA